MMRSENYRPHINDTGNDLTGRVRELSKNGEYLKEKFHKSKISSNSNTVLGFKEFIIAENYKGHDRGFYETLLNDNSQQFFPTYCRYLELGEFKNNLLHGFGARYLYEGYGYKENEEDICKTAAIIGNFNEGLPNKKMMYYDVSNNAEEQCFALMEWDNGKLLEFHEHYFDGNINIQDEIINSRFYHPLSYHKDAWWEAYKNEFL